MNARVGDLAGRGALGLKQPSCISQIVRDSAEGETCTLRLGCCNGDIQTTILAHIRQFGWAGVAQKPADFLTFYACSACHDAFDGRTRDPWGWDDVMRAHGETLLRMHAKGLLTLKGTK